MSSRMPTRWASVTLSIVHTLRGDVVHQVRATFFEEEGKATAVEVDPSAGADLVAKSKVLITGDSVYDVMMTSTGLPPPPPCS